MCSKLHLNDLKTVAGVRDAIFHQWSVNNSTEHLFTPASIPPPSFISWGYNNYFIYLLNALRSSSISTTHCTVSQTKYIFVIRQP